MEYVIYQDKKYYAKNNILRLSSLDIKDISEIDGLENLKIIQELDLSDNLITEIKGLEPLTSLQILELSNNQITEMKGLETLISLQILDLSGNKIPEIKGLGTLTSLRELILFDNMITEIKGLETLKSLQTLMLSGNQITEIKGLENLSSLQYLSLSKNQITEIKGLETLIALKLLLLSGNQIAEIEGLETLTSLKELQLSWNQITEIKGLDTLINLNHLNLADNKIKNLENLETLENLRSLDLMNNPFEGVEDYLVNIETKAKVILEYCRNKKLEINEIKFLDEYELNKSFKENVEKFKTILSKKDASDFINIGTNLEIKNIAIMQNLIFYNQLPREILLNNKDKTPEQLKMNFIQINSLKGVDSEKHDKIGHFLFFTKQFWDENELVNNVLVYNQNNPWINSKIDEFLTLSLLTNPKLIVFPENSVPYSMIEKLIAISKKNRITIVCGLEHRKHNSEYINKALIIDNGKCGEQVKQTPVEIKRYNGNHIRENIKCEIFPKIDIFLTSIGRIAIFICKDFLRLCNKIPGWARKNNIDFIIIPSLTSKILPFHTKLINLLNYSSYSRLKLIFSSIGEYGGSEFFSIDHINRIEQNFRKNIRDNIGEVIVSRNYTFRGENVRYQNGYVHIICDNCGSEYSITTNGAHLLEESAFSIEKDKWEFYLQCNRCGYKNYRY